eukprot:TRINITY_DN8801_c0_g1_i2.p1 TRINITY_DN8801_c0_g1~~TRINITY_DN8801_c0_g1_i2.p1  ORF type:complete len:264 (+),score=9.71 TRINITY_DN8801_c0_g1_i2:25-816(+)
MILVFLLTLILECFGTLKPTISNGGWDTYPEDVMTSPGPCNIPIRDSTLSHQEFMDLYAHSQPFVIRDGANNDLFRALTGKEHLIYSYGDSIVRLSSANSYSYEKRDMKFREYCKNYLFPQNRNTLGNETFYMFGDNDNEEWGDLLNEYRIPSYNLPKHSPALSFGVAGPGSGVPFHFHGPGFAEAIHGRKRWFLTKPDDRPTFHPNKTTLQWYFEDYPTVKKEMELYECTIRPGEAIYFPDKWWHATLNLDTSVFISTFLSP